MKFKEMDDAALTDVTGLQHPPVDFSGCGNACPDRLSPAVGARESLPESFALLTFRAAGGLL
jgi:hypothetical protein